MKRMLYAVLAVLVIFGAGCQVVFDTEKSETYTETYAVADGYIRLILNNESGDVNVSAAETDSIAIEYTKTCWGTNERDAEEHLNDIDISIAGTKSDSTVTISADFPLIEETRNYEAVFNLIVPPDMILDLSANKGNIDISGMSRSPRLETSDGKITITDFSCDVEAKTTNGDIECTLDNLPSSGQVSLTTEDGYQTLIINAMDTTSTIVLDATKIGKIEATLPSHAKLDFYLHSDDGDVDIQGFEYVQDSVEAWGNQHKVGTIGEGTRSSITATSAKGDVILKAGE